MKALVLSGGNVKGAFQAGAIEVLRSKGHDWDIIAGISVGAINGAAMACGRWPEAYQMWHSVTESQIIKKRNLFSVGAKWLRSRVFGRPPQGLRDTGPLRETLYDVIKHRRLEKRFYAGRVDLMTGAYESHVPMGSTVPRIIDYVISSAAVPVVMDPHIQDSSLWVDGGLHNITPLNDVLSNHIEEISEVTIITTQPMKTHPGGIFNKRPQKVDLVQIAQQSLSYILDVAFNRDLKHFLDRNQLVQQATQPLKNAHGRMIKYVPYQLIQPAESLGPGNDYSRTNIDRLLQIGINTTKKLDL